MLEKVFFEIKNGNVSHSLLDDEINNDGSFNFTEMAAADTAQATARYHRAVKRTVGAFLTIIGVGVIEAATLPSSEWSIYFIVGSEAFLMTLFILSYCLCACQDRHKIRNQTILNRYTIFANNQDQLNTDQASMLDNLLTIEEQKDAEKNVQIEVVNDSNNPEEDEEEKKASSLKY
jgi:hypothetical protein